MSILSHAFNIIIDSEISAQVHRIEVVDGINVTDKGLIFHLMATEQLPDIQIFDTQIEMNTSKHNNGVSLVQQLSKNLSNA